MLTIFDRWLLQSAVVLLTSDVTLFVQMFSDLPASRIVELHRKETATNNDSNHLRLLTVPTKTSKFSTGVSIVSTHQFVHFSSIFGTDQSLLR